MPRKRKLNEPVKPGCLIILISFIVIAIWFLSVIFSDPSPGEENQTSKTIVTEVDTKEQKAEIVEKVTDSSHYAILSGKDPETGELLLEDINVWENAGGLDRGGMAIGNVPHNTKVEVLEEKEVDGNVFYHIRSSVGKVSILPTDFNARKVAMEERPKEEWHVYADESFPVEGWVIDSFILELSE